MKALFADPTTNASLKIGGVNSINVSRILAQITYYFASYFSLIRSGTFDPSTDAIRFVVPTGNFGDILAGYFAKRMGLPISKLIVATNENDILHRFWQTGAYEKKLFSNGTAEGGLAKDGAKAHPEGVKATLSPAMDINLSSNLERLLWFLEFDTQSPCSGLSTLDERQSAAGHVVKTWQHELKTAGSFRVNPQILEAARHDFASERVSDPETLATIRTVYNWPVPNHPKGYILDPHSAIGVAAALRSAKAAPGVHNVALATAHPAKFSGAVELALQGEAGFQFGDILPVQFAGLDKLPRRVIRVRMADGLEGIRRILLEEVERELERMCA